MPSSQKEDAMDEGGDGGEKSVLQAKLTNLAIQIGYAGMAVSLITVAILCIKFSVITFHFQEKTFEPYYINFYVKFVIIGVTSFSFLMHWLIRFLKKSQLPISRLWRLFRTEGNSL